MTDRIDTDAIRGHYLSGVGLRRANWEAYIFSDLARLCDALDNSRADLKMSVILRDGAEEAASEANRVVQEVQQYVQAYAEGYVGNPRQQGLARLALARIETALNGTSPPPADPAPVRLTEAEREVVEVAATVGLTGLDSSPYLTGKLLAIIDRLSAAPIDDRERVPEGWRVEWRRHLIPETSMFVSGRTSQYEDRPYLVPVSPSVDPIELAEECVCRSDGYDHGLYSAECPAHVAARHSVDPEGGVMDPAELAEGRKLLAEAREIGWPPDLPRSEALNKWLVRHADALLASVDPEER